ncbi:MAG: hypothetical protein IJ473_02505 [Alphaproteobacteria bacterium]|nr:hypothetical protein [Alphaproteobacteria bacterium]
MLFLLISFHVMASGVQTEQSDHAKAEEKLSIEEFKYNLTHQTKVQIHFSIDDILGNYYEFPNSKKLDFTISKEKTGKIKIDDFSHKYTFICDIDKETDEDIYLNCEKLNEEWDWFKYPYIIISKMKSNLISNDNYLFIIYHLLGKENWEKFECDEKEKNEIYDRINCTTIEQSGYKREE